MTIMQTVKIPANRQVTLDVPPQIPAGTTARLELMWFPEKSPLNDLDSVLEKIWAICKDSPITVDSFLEMRRRDTELEENQYRQFLNSKDTH